MMAPSAAVHALGMGEIEVHSALNEPLQARIKLLSVTTGELSALKVALASKEAFGRMGIDLSPSLRDLRFEVVSQGAGSPYIRVVSETPIREPFLDLILMANWSNGQLLREYTLLLDPPVFDEGEAVAPVQAAKTEAVAIDRGAKKTVVAAPASQPAPWVATAGDYGPTKRTDTLWTVARDMRTDKTTTVPQMMLALLKENPEAFVGGNVNNLKAGYILRSPDLDVINSVSSSMAAAEVNRQYQTWQAADERVAPRSSRQQLASSSGTPPEKTGQAVPVPASAEAGARLKLLSPEEVAQSSGGGAGVQGKGGVTERLAMAMEIAEATKQENAELKARLTDLERQLQAVQRLLTLKGDTLGALQSGLAGQELGDAGQAQPDAAVPVIDAAPVVDQSTPAVEPEMVAADAVTEVEPVSVVTEPLPDVSIVDEILADPVLLGAAVGGPLLLLLVAGLIRRRRQQQSELDAADALGEGLYSSAKDEVTAKDRAELAGGAVSNSAADESFDDLVGSGAGSDFGSSSGVGAIHAEENEIDPIAEADVYLAYRRYEQAEALLKEAIRNDGGRNELKLKLLEIYFATKDRDAFEAQAEGLYASLAGQEDDLWMQAVEMGREIAPDHPLFAEAGGSSGAPVVAAATTAAAAVLAGDAVAGDEFKFDVADSDEGISFDLSDEDLAKSLNMSSLDGEVADSGVDLSVNDLPSLSGDDLSPSHELEELVSEDDFALGSGDRNGLSEIDGSLMLEGHELSFEESDLLDADKDIAFSLGDEMVPADALDDFDGGLDELTAGFDLDDLDDLEGDAISMKPESTDSEISSDEWTIAPAVSSFQSREIKTEMDDGYVPVVNVAKDLPMTAGADSLVLAEDESFAMPGEEETIFEGADDIVGTKLDLARAYIEMGDQGGARSILDEVVKEGGDSHRLEAEQLMRQIS